MKNHGLPYAHSALLTASIVCFAFLVWPTRAASQEKFYYIELFAVDNVDILDSKGSTLQPISPVAGLALRNVNYDPGTEVEGAEQERKLNPDQAQFWAPHTIWFLANTANHEIRFRTTASRMMHFEIRRGTGLNQADAELLIRYVDVKDLGMRPGLNARIRFTRDSVGDLEMDTDVNGSYETNIKPQFLAVGSHAKDEQAPRVTINTTISGNIATITFSATDAGSGVKEIHYNIDNGPNHGLYTGPFKLDISKEVTVFAIADDVAGNRSLDFKVFGGGEEKIGADPYNLRGDPLLRKSKPAATDVSRPTSDPFQLKSKPF